MALVRPKHRTGPRCFRMKRMASSVPSLITSSRLARASRTSLGPYQETQTSIAHISKLENCDGEQTSEQCPLRAPRRSLRFEVRAVHCRWIFILEPWAAPMVFDSQREQHAGGDCPHEQGDQYEHGPQVPPARPLGNLRGCPKAGPRLINAYVSRLPPPGK